MVVHYLASLILAISVGADGGRFGVDRQEASSHCNELDLRQTDRETVLLAQSRLAHDLSRLAEAEADMAEWLGHPGPWFRELILDVSPSIEASRAITQWRVHLLAGFTQARFDALEAYCESLRASAPSRAPDVERLRHAAVRRALLGFFPSGDGCSLSRSHETTAGEDVDLIAVLTEVAAQEPAFTFDRDAASPALTAALDEYEQQLDALIRQRFAAVLEHGYLASGFAYGLPEINGVSEAHWINDLSTLLTRVRGTGYAIRQHNLQYAARIRDALPQAAATPFFEQARAAISPFAHGPRGYSPWMRHAGASLPTDDPLHERLLDLESALSSRRESLAAHAVRAYERMTSPSGAAAVAQAEAEHRAAAPSSPTTPKVSIDIVMQFDEALRRLREFDADALKLIQEALGARAAQVSGLVEEERQQLDAQQAGSQPERVAIGADQTVMRYLAPFITASELHTFMDTQAGLTETDRSTLVALHEDFAMSLAEAARLHEQRRTSRESEFSTTNLRQMSPEELNEWIQMQASLRDDWIRTRNTRERTFEQDVRLVLSEPSWRDWQRWCVHIRFARLMPTIRGQLDESRHKYLYDLGDLLASLNFVDITQEALAPVMDEYYAELDIRLRRFEDRWASAWAEMMERSRRSARSGRPADQRAVARQVELVQNLSGSILALRFEYVDRIANTLPSPDRDVFLDAIAAHEFPWSVTISPIQIIDAALDDTTALDEALRQVIDEQIASFMEEEQRIVGELRSLTMQYDQSDDSDEHLRLIDRIMGLRTDRYRGARTACAAIGQLFTDAQFAELPPEVGCLVTVEQ